MKTKIIVTIKSVYGNPTAYPANDTAHQFAELLGTKTLTAAHLAKIKKLGFEIVQQAPTLLNI